MRSCIAIFFISRCLDAFLQTNRQMPESCNSSNIKRLSLTIAKKTENFVWSEYLENKPHNLECSKFLDNNKASFSQYNSTGRIILDKEPPLSMKCADIERRITRLGTNSEVENPLAVARNVNEDYYLQEILLAQSYSLSNAFCYAMDVKSSGEFKTLMRIMASCLPNVIVLNETFKFDSGGHFQNHAHYACMKQLLSYSKWKYVILLQNAEVFIKTPHEISKILGILNGAPIFRSEKVWPNRVPKKKITAKSMGLFINETNKTKEQLETVFKFRKTPVAMLLPRNFINEIVQSLNLTKLLAAFNNEKVYGTDEYLFGTLASAHFLKLPGQVEHQCMTGPVMRYAHWNYGKESNCKSHKKRHNVCLLGEEYLKTLHESNFIIANKVWPGFDFGAIMCIDTLFHKNINIKRDWKKILSFYSNFPNVLEQKLREKGTFNITSFKC